MRERYVIGLSLMGAGVSLTRINEVLATIAAAGAAGLVWWKVVDKCVTRYQAIKARQLRIKQAELEYESKQKEIERNRPTSDFGGPHHLI